jgi:hypothetical protein
LNLIHPSRVAAGPQVRPFAPRIEIPQSNPPPRATAHPDPPKCAKARHLFCQMIKTKPRRVLSTAKTRIRLSLRRFVAPSLPPFETNPNPDIPSHSRPSVRRNIYIANRTHQTPVFPVSQHTQSNPRTPINCLSLPHHSLILRASAPLRSFHFQKPKPRTNPPKPHWRSKNPSRAPRRAIQICFPIAEQSHQTERFTFRSVSWSPLTDPEGQEHR